MAQRRAAMRPQLVCLIALLMAKQLYAQITVNLGGSIGINVGSVARDANGNPCSTVSCRAGNNYDCPPSAKFKLADLGCTSSDGQDVSFQKEDMLFPADGDYTCPPRGQSSQLVAKGGGGCPVTRTITIRGLDWRIDAPCVQKTTVTCSNAPGNVFTCVAGTRIKLSDLRCTASNGAKLQFAREGNVLASGEDGCPAAGRQTDIIAGTGGACPASSTITVRGVAMTGGPPCANPPPIECPGHTTDFVGRRIFQCDSGGQLTPQSVGCKMVAPGNRGAVQAGRFELFDSQDKLTAIPCPQAGETSDQLYRLRVSYSSTCFTERTFQLRGSCKGPQVACADVNNGLFLCKPGEQVRFDKLGCKIVDPGNTVGATLTFGMTDSVGARAWRETDSITCPSDAKGAEYSVFAGTDGCLGDSIRVTVGPGSGVLPVGFCGRPPIITCSAHQSEGGQRIFDCKPGQELKPSDVGCRVLPSNAALDFRGPDPTITCPPAGKTSPASVRLLASLADPNPNIDCSSETSFFLRGTCQPPRISCKALVGDRFTCKAGAPLRFVDLGCTASGAGFSAADLQFSVRRGDAIFADPTASLGFCVDGTTLLITTSGFCAAQLPVAVRATGTNTIPTNAKPPPRFNEPKDWAAGTSTECLPATPKAPVAIAQCPQRQTLPAKQVKGPVVTTAAVGSEQLLQPAVINADGVKQEFCRSTSIVGGITLQYTFSATDNCQQTTASRTAIRMNNRPPFMPAPSVRVGDKTYSAIAGDSDLAWANPVPVASCSALQLPKGKATDCFAGKPNNPLPDVEPTVLDSQTIAAGGTNQADRTRTLYEWRACDPECEESFDTCVYYFLAVETPVCDAAATP